MIEQHEPPTFHKRAQLPPRRRMNLVVTSEQLAALLNLPPDVTVAAFTLDWLRDSVVFALNSDRFDVVPPHAEAQCLPAAVEVSVDDRGIVTQRVTWEGLEGAGVVARFGGDTYRHRSGTVRARQWLGANEAEIQELTGGVFYALDDEDRASSDDPEATANLLTAPHSTSALLYDGDWVVQHGDGFTRMTDDEFVAEFGPVKP